MPHYPGHKNLKDKKRDSLSGMLKNVKMRDTGKKREEMELKVPDKFYPTITLTEKHMPELKELPKDSTCRFVVEAKLKGFHDNSYHLEIHRVGKLDSY